jgi:hypothetical protein
MDEGVLGDSTEGKMGIPFPFASLNPIDAADSDIDHRWVRISHRLVPSTGAESAKRTKSVQPFSMPKESVASSYVSVSLLCSRE